MSFVVFYYTDLTKTSLFTFSFVRIDIGTDIYFGPILSNNHSKTEKAEFTFASAPNISKGVIKKILLLNQDDCKVQ